MAVHCHKSVDRVEAHLHAGGVSEAWTAESPQCRRLSLCRGAEAHPSAHLAGFHVQIDPENYLHEALLRQKFRRKRGLALPKTDFARRS